MSTRLVNVLSVAVVVLVLSWDPKPVATAAPTVDVVELSQANCEGEKVVNSDRFDDSCVRLGLGKFVPMSVSIQGVVPCKLVGFADDSCLNDEKDGFVSLVTDDCLNGYSYLRSVLWSARC